MEFLAGLVPAPREGKMHARAARDAAYRFMQAIAGDLADFEEATRALYADDRTRFASLIAPWPKDVREHATALAFPAQRKDAGR